MGEGKTYCILTLAKFATNGRKFDMCYLLLNPMAYVLHDLWYQSSDTTINEEMREKSSFFRNWLIPTRCLQIFIYMTMYLLRLVTVAQVFEVFQVWYFVIFNGEVIAYLNYLWVTVEKIINNRFYRKYFFSSFSPWIFFEKVSFNVLV